MSSWQRSSYRTCSTLCRSEASRRIVNSSSGRVMESCGLRASWPSHTCLTIRLCTRWKRICSWHWLLIYLWWQLLKVRITELCGKNFEILRHRIIMRKTHLCKTWTINFNLFTAIARRRRPSVNDDPFCIGPDVYSFPSGHASRSSLLLGFFTCLFPFSYFVWPPLFAWWFAICISR